MTLGKLTDKEFALISAKSKKNEEVVQLYRDHDFLEAYAKSTDYRVEHDGYRAAVGGEHDWERHGVLQSEFLKSVGLRPQDWLLDIGCGTGRLARKIVPFLNARHYTGFDLSTKAIAAAEALSVEEGWAARRPRLTTEWPHGKVFDVLWAFSVSIHLPEDEMLDLWKRAASVMRPNSRFYFSYNADSVNLRTGLKQFRKTQATYDRIIKAAGFLVATTKWSGEQTVVRGVLA